MNRRGHIFLGVATRQTALGSYLGADRHGWGYLVSQDLYHGGSRLRSGYGSRMSAGMTVELTLNTDIGLLSVGNADTGEDFGTAMSNLYEDIDSASGVISSLGGGSGGGNRDARIDGRGAGASSTRLVAAAANAAAAATLAVTGRVGGDAQGTLWPAFAMHQPGDSVTFLPRRAEDGYTLPRSLASSGPSPVASAALAAATAAGPYRSLNAFMGGMGNGMISGIGGMGAGEGFAGQALPLGYPNPLLMEHARVALEMAAVVLREAVCGGAGVAGEDLDGDCVGVVTR